MQMQWEVYVKQHGTVEHESDVPLATFKRRIDGATAADFGLSLAEARQLLAKLQQVVMQSQVRTYDHTQRHCIHCGAYRRIKDWRPRFFASSLGEVQVRVPRVYCCICTDEPLDDDGMPTDLHHFACPIERQLPHRRTPEFAYLCAKHGATNSYRTAASIVGDLTNMPKLSHMRVRRETIESGKHIEDAQFTTGWFAGNQKRNSAEHLRVSIDGTAVSAVPREGMTKFEIVAGRIERDGKMGRRFACALPRRSLTGMLVRAALEQSGWNSNTLIDVANDGARGMRSLVTSVTPCIAKPVLDWFHIGMKLRAVQTPLCASAIAVTRRPELMKRCESIWREVREALWRGHAEKAIETTRSLIATLDRALTAHELPPFLHPALRQQKEQRSVCWILWKTIARFCSTTTRPATPANEFPRPLRNR
jgi:hypothetical protein